MIEIMFKTSHILKINNVTKVFSNDSILRIWHKHSHLSTTYKLEDILLYKHY